MRTSLLHLRTDGEQRRLRRQGNAAPEALATCDPAVQRIRAAGGPVDHACYTCECGYLFSAPVSATVVCPRCGADQAW